MSRGAKALRQVVVQAATRKAKEELFKSVIDSELVKIANKVGDIAKKTESIIKENDTQKTLHSKDSLERESENGCNRQSSGKLKIKVLEGGIIPTLGTIGSAGYDLYVREVEYLNNSNTKVKYNTGICVEIPVGYVGLLFPKSSVSKKDLRMCNSVGVIDSDYRGEISACFDIDWTIPMVNTYNVGDACCQLVIVPFYKVSEFEVVDELSDTDRGTGGYGSTIGKKGVKIG